MTTGPTTPSAVSVVHQGIEYAGGFFRAPAWNPSFGEPLTGDAYFRVVFLEHASAVFPRAIHDHRIAVYVPGARSPELDRAEVELRVMREAMGSYAAESESIDLLSSENDDIEQRAVGAWAASFRDGQLIAAPALDADLGALFADGYWSTWAERIGTLLIARAYPDAPVRHDLMQTPLRPNDDAPMLFDALSGVGDATAAFAIDAFGAGLGLSVGASGQPPSSTFQRLAEMATTGWAPDAIGHALAHEQGVTYPLATLYLLQWVRDGQHALRLRPGHGLLQRNGERFAKDTLSADDLASLRWPLGLWDRIESLEPAGAPDAVDAHLAALAGPVGQGESLPGAAGRRLAELRDDLPSVLLAVGNLTIAQGDSSLPAQAIDLQRIAAGDSVATAIDIAKQAYPDAGAFAGLLTLWHAWGNNDAHATRMGHEIDWLRSALVDEESTGLFTEREALMTRIHARGLLTAPHEWPPLVEHLRLFKQRYAVAYLAYHQEHHATLAHLAHLVDEVWRKANALDRLNEISELGTPMGEGLLGLAEEMRNTVIACGMERAPADVLLTPLCPACAMHIGAGAPAREVAQLASYVNDALGEQNRRLATRVAHQIIERPEHVDLDRFIQMVQISDLGGLANVLDDQVVAFIRGLLQPNTGGSGIG
jgi:hypothetical protein